MIKSTTHSADKLAWLEFRHIVKVMGRLMVNLTDFNAVHFGPSSLRHRKSSIKATTAAGKARKLKAKARKKQRRYKNRPSLEALWQKLR